MADNEDKKLATLPVTPVPVPVSVPVRSTSSGSAESSSSSMGSTSTSTNSNHSNICSVCHAPVSNTKSQWTHRWLHADKSFYDCKVCGEKFDDFEMLKQHEQIHLGSSLQELPHNIKQPLNLDIVEDESAGSEAIEIIVAERIMEAEETIKTEKEELGIVVSVSTSPMVKNNAQPVRSTGKTGQESMETDVETEASDSKDILQIPSGMMSDQSSKETRTEPCAKCDMLFCSQLSYQRHLQQAHNEITVYPCIHCGQIFYRSVALYQHVQALHKTFPGGHFFAQEPSKANRDSDSEHGNFNPEQGSPSTTTTTALPSPTRPAAHQTRLPKTRKLLTDAADRDSKEELMNHSTLQPLPNPHNIPERPPRPSVVKFHTRAVECHQLPISASQQNLSSSPHVTSYLFNGGGSHPVEKIPYDFKPFGSQSNRSEIETASPTDSNNNVNGAGRKNPEGMTKTWVPLHVKKDDGNECPEEDRNQKKHSVTRDSSHSKRLKLFHERDYRQHDSYLASRGVQEPNSIMNEQHRVTGQQMLYPPMNTYKVFNHCHHPRYGSALSNGSVVHHHHPSQIYSNNYYSYNNNNSYDYAPSVSRNWNSRNHCNQNGSYPHLRESGSSCNNYHRTVVGNQNQSYCKIDPRVSPLANHASLIYKSDYSPSPQSVGQLPTSRYNPYQTPRVVIPFPRQSTRQDDTHKCMNASSVAHQCGYTHDQQQLASQSLPEKVLRNVNTLPNNKDVKRKEGETSPTFSQRKRSLGQIIPISSHPPKYVQQCNLYKTSKGTLQLDDVFYPTDNDNSRAGASYIGNRNRRHVIDGQVIRFYRGTDSAEASSENSSATSQDIIQVRKEPEIANIKDTGNPIKIKMEPKATRRKPRVLKKNTNSNKVKIPANNKKNGNGHKAQTKGQKKSSPTPIPSTDINADNRFEFPVSDIKLETQVSGDEPPLCKKLPIMGDNFILLLDPKTETEDSMESSSAEVSKNKDEISQNGILEYGTEIEVQSTSDPVMMANQVIEIPDDKETEDIKEILSAPECEEIDNHPNNNNNTSDKSNEIIFSCSICQKRFYSELHAKVHEVCMHEEM